MAASLAGRLRVELLVNNTVYLGRVPGRAPPKHKVMTPTHGLLAGADSIDEWMCCGGSHGLVLGHRVMVPSTSRTVHAFSLHVRQLDRVLDQAHVRAWAVIAALAHNLGRWSGKLGLPDEVRRIASMRRRRPLEIPGLLTHTAREWTLQLPARWPRRQQPSRSGRIRALPAPA